MCWDVRLSLCLIFDAAGSDYCSLCRHQLILAYWWSLNRLHQQINAKEQIYKTSYIYSQRNIQYNKIVLCATSIEQACYKNRTSSSLFAVRSGTGARRMFEVNAHSVLAMRKFLPPYQHFLLNMCVSCVCTWLKISTCTCTNPRLLPWLHSIFY